jgi:predicted ATPase
MPTTSRPLCRHLDGIPLALELAAARIRVLAPLQILQRLQSQLDFLQTREVGVPERQRTLRATIEWSYNQLPPEQRDFFNRLSVFRGGWTLEAAEAICADEDSSTVDVVDVLDFLERLREYSMIVTQDTSGGTRFRVLEVLREWGAKELSHDEELHRALQERHFAYHLA